MSILRNAGFTVLPALFGGFLLFSPVAVYADLSMKPRTCSNCSGFSNAPAITHHRPSAGITGHRSFGITPQYKNYRPKTYNSFKHPSKHDYQRHDKSHYRDHRPRVDGYRHHDKPRHHHSGISLGIVAPIVYSGAYYSNAVPSYSPSTSNTRPTTLPQQRQVPTNNIDAWAALGSYQSAAALNGFAYQSQQNPRNALPKVGYALATAVNGEYDKAAWAMDLALAADVTDLHYFQADTDVQLVLAEMLLNYPDKALMRSTLLYLKQDYSAAETALTQAMGQCQDCRAEQNLQDLIQRKGS